MGEKRLMLIIVHYVQRMYCASRRGPRPLIACHSFFSSFFPVPSANPAAFERTPLGSPTSVLCLILRRENAREGIPTRAFPHIHSPTPCSAELQTRQILSIMQ